MKERKKYTVYKGRDSGYISYFPNHSFSNQGYNKSGKSYNVGGLLISPNNQKKRDPTQSVFSSSQLIFPILQRSPQGSTSAPFWSAHPRRTRQDALSSLDARLHVHPLMNFFFPNTAQYGSIQSKIGPDMGQNTY